MKKYIFFALPVVVLLYSLFYFQDEKKRHVKSVDNVYQFKVDEPGDRFVLDTFVSFSGATAIDSTYYKLENIQQIIHTPNHIVIYDGNSDFIERLCFIDPASQKIVKEIHFPKLSNGSLQGVRNIVYSASERCFYAYAGGRGAILMYGESGDYLGEIFIGVYGNKMALTPDGEFLVETSINEPVDDSFHRLIHFDRNGDIKAKYFPYPPQKEIFLIGNTGIMEQIDGRVYYAWPLGDTLFCFENGLFTPVLVANFGATTIPAAFRNNPDALKGATLPHSSFLLSEFNYINQTLVLSYNSKSAEKAFAFWDTKRGRTVNTLDAVPNALSPIFKMITLAGRYNDQLIFYMTQERAITILLEKKPELQQMRQRQPELYTALVKASENVNPTLFYFRVS